MNPLARPALVAAAVLGVLLAALAGTAALFLPLLGSGSGGGQARLAPMCALTAVAASPAGTSLTGEQLRNAATIVQVGRRERMPAYGLTIALATALQESGLRNLTWGDRDSIGLFQQRPSAGWGNREEILDPVYSARRFYAALREVRGWQSMPLTHAAQAVQRSAFPFAYARHEPVAAALVKRITGKAAGACRAVARGPWRLPLASGYTLTSAFGLRVHPIRGTTDMHTGLDFAAAMGTPIGAATSGVVIRAGDGGGYGRLVVVRHADGVETWYAHLSAIDVRAGQRVRTGDALGAVGTTGNSTGPHLHLEVRVDGSPVDPARWLAARGIRA